MSYIAWLVVFVVFAALELVSLGLPVYGLPLEL